MVAETARVAVVSMPATRTAFVPAVLSWVIPTISSLLVALFAFWLGRMGAYTQEKREAYTRVFGRVSDLLKTLHTMEELLLVIRTRVFQLSESSGASGATTTEAPGEFSSRVFVHTKSRLTRVIRTVAALEGCADDVVREYVGCATHFPTLERAVTDARSEVRRFSVTLRRAYLRLSHPERWVAGLGPADVQRGVAEMLLTVDNERAELGRCFDELTYLFRRRAFGRPRRAVPVEGTGNPDMRILTEDGMKTARELGVCTEE